MRKSAIYKEYIARMDAAHSDKHYLEAIWYAYAVLEDRLISMLQNSGGIPTSNDGKPIRMLGPKRTELVKRAKTDKLLKGCFDNTNIQVWAKKRNDLMHGMADGSMSILVVDELAKETADSGVALVREVCAAGMRLKRYRKSAGK